MKRILIGLLAVGFAIGLLAYLGRTALTMRLMKRVAARTLATDLIQELPDGLHVALCGAGSPLPDPERSGPCVAVVAGERLFVVDAGAGASRVLATLRIPQGAVDAILLTHFHSDHIDGLGELLLQRWVNGAHTTPVPVHGPEGVETVVDGFNQAYGLDRRYRVAHHGPKAVPPSGAGASARPFATPPEGESVVLFDDVGVKVAAFRVDHDPVVPAVGYRFDYGGRSVVISGDTVKSANLEHFARGADLLVHEALAPQIVAVITEATVAAGRDNLSKITRDILDYHTTPVEAAELAQAAGANHLLYYHVVPPLRLTPMVEIFLEGVDDAYEGPVTVGRDGTLAVLEAGRDTIEVRELL